MLLSDVCLLHSSRLRTERPRKTKIDTEIAYITRDSDTIFKVKGQGHQATLLSMALTHKAAVSMGTYLAWESTATSCLLSGTRGAGVHTGEE